MKKSVIMAAFCGFLVLAWIGQVKAGCPCDKLQQPDARFYLHRGDSYFTQRGKSGMAQKAAQDFSRALQGEPGNVEAAWKLARALFYVGEKAPQDKREAIFQRAMEVCQTALSHDPLCVPCHYFLGVSYGMYGKARGILSSLDLVEPMQKEAQRVIELDPAYDHGGAYRLLGRIYFKLPALFGGDNQLAEQNLLKALDLGPRDYRTHLFLAELYLNEGREKQARELLHHVMSGQAYPGMEHEDQENKAKARAMLAELDG